VRFGHPSGTLRVGAAVKQVDGEWTVAKAVMSRSAHPDGRLGAGAGRLFLKRPRAAPSCGARSHPMLRHPDGCIPTAVRLGAACRCHRGFRWPPHRCASGSMRCIRLRSDARRHRPRRRHCSGRHRPSPGYAAACWSPPSPRLRLPRQRRPT
jgi:hypothetical protein